MKTPTGEVNPNYIDVLDEDKPVAGQRFFAMSFISPEKILREKIKDQREEIRKMEAKIKELAR